MRYGFIFLVVKRKPLHLPRKMVASSMVKNRAIA